MTSSCWGAVCSAQVPKNDVKSMHTPSSSSSSSAGFLELIAEQFQKVRACPCDPLGPGIQHKPALHYSVVRICVSGTMGHMIHTDRSAFPLPVDPVWPGDPTLGESTGLLQLMRALPTELPAQGVAHARRLAVQRQPGAPRRAGGGGRCHGGPAFLLCLPTAQA